MAHMMRDDEGPATKVAPERLGRKGGEALDRLRAVADRGGREATLVAALLESAADAAESHTPSDALPDAERALWTAVGATFDARARRRNDERLVEAFGSLLDTCIVGDAVMAKALGVDRSRVSQRLADRSLYAFTAGDERCFPRWQLLDRKPLPGLRAVLREIDPALHPLSVHRWFTTANVDLEIDGESVSPVAWLATGGDAQVAAVLAADL